MRLFPVFHDLRGRPVLLLGGAPATAAKARLLLDAGAEVTAVALAPAAEVARLAEAGRLRLCRRQPSAADFAGAVLAIVATGEAAADAAIARLARAASVPVNVVDRPALSDFQMPAIVDRAPVLLAISTGGAAPALAAWLRHRIEAALPWNLSRLAAFAARARPAIADAGPARRRRLWQRLLDGPAADLALAGREDAALVQLRWALAAEDEPPAGGVGLIGAGPGDPDLLTLKARRLLRRADVVIHDDAVAADIVALARRDAERIDIAGYEPARIDGLLLRQARRGRRVARLAAGAGADLGRELAALSANGIAAEWVPGVAAAAAVPAPIAARRAAS